MQKASGINYTEAKNLNITKSEEATVLTSKTAASSQNILSAIVRNLAKRQLTSVESTLQDPQTSFEGVNDICKNICAPASATLLTKGIPLSTTVTVKTVERGQDSQYVNEKREPVRSLEINKNVSDSPFIQLSTISDISKKSVESFHFHKNCPVVSVPILDSRTFTPLNQSNIQTIDKHVEANHQNVGMQSQRVSLPSASRPSQLTNNRLQLKVQSPLQMATLQSPPLFKQAPVNDILWSSGATSTKPVSSSQMLSSITKTLNQSIRQIPNPSLLTKQNQDDFSN
jgi:hypothetical protein